MQRNSISCVGATALAAALRDNRWLLTLIVRFNRIANKLRRRFVDDGLVHTRCRSNSGAMAIGVALKSDCVLKVCAVVFLFSR